MYRTLTHYCFATVIAFCCGVIAAGTHAATITIYPFITADGTIVDSDLDYSPDAAEWAFNGTSQYAGAIALVKPGAGESPFERRVIWEYDLRGITYLHPVSAALTYAIRGAPIWPFPPVDVNIYAYPGDLTAQLSDYNLGPAVLQGRITVFPSVLPGQGMAVGALNVSDAVNAALNAGAVSIGFRFQIDPATPNDRNEAFIDADDGEPETKPALIIDEVIPFDTDLDNDVDGIDYGQFAPCMKGVDVAASIRCVGYDADYDGNVDLRDFEMLQRYFTGER